MTRDLPARLGRHSVARLLLHAAQAEKRVGWSQYPPELGAHWACVLTTSLVSAPL
jgi:hypothetical protein